MNAQLFTIDFETDGCGGNGCDMTENLIGNGCVFIKNTNIPVLSLYGGNRLTNDGCVTWVLAADGKHSVPLNGPANRKLLFHKNGNMNVYGNTTEIPVGDQQGIFVEIPIDRLPNNHFYQVQFDMEQIFPYGCGGISIDTTGHHHVFTQQPKAPTINVYARIAGPWRSGFQVNSKSYNEALKDPEEFIGLFTTNGMDIGVYDSLIFKFNDANIAEDGAVLQLAFFNDTNDAGVCDETKDTTILSRGLGLIQEHPFAALIDNIQIDCDQKNIVFDAKVSLVPFDELLNCNKRLYKLVLSTDCPYVNYDHYPYFVTIKNQNGIEVKSFSALGEVVYFDMEDIPTGNYTVSIAYDTSGGYNLLATYFDDAPSVIIHHEQDAPYRVIDTEVFDNVSYVPTDIIIMPGGHLIVNNTVYMKQNKRITVRGDGRLDVNTNGHLTTCDTEWFGVIVQGSGQVYMNGSLSNSFLGITTNTNAHGKIHTNGAHFYDNRIVHVQAYGSTETSFVNTDFIGGERGVYLINVTGGTTSNGVLFDGNRFSYQTKEGIIAVNTEINVVNGNQFTGCEEGIAVRNLLGSFEESLIGGYASPTKNLFSSCGKGIYANASKQKVQNNIFTSCNNAVWMSGYNGYESEFNSFSGGYNAEGLFSTGSTTNISEHNDYNGAVYGIRAYFQNDNYTFLANCFYSGGKDVEAYGTVSGAQGNEILAASNCFTHANYVIDLDCNTNHFLYYVPKPTIAYPPCLYPMTPGTYDVEPSSGNQNSNQCGTSLNGPLVGEYDYIKALGCDSTVIHNYILNYRAQLKALQKKLTPLTKAERAKVAWLTRHLRYLIHQWAWCLRKQGKNPELYAWYKSQEDKDYTIKAAGVLVSMQQYDKALAALDSIQTDYEMNPSLIAAMKLNIIYTRTGMEPDSITPAQLNLLRSVAAMSDPQAAYGRSLLYLLTGEKIEPLIVSNVNLRSVPSADREIKELYRAYPNPASDMLNIAIENMSMDGNYQYELKDVTGRSLLRGKIYHDTSADIASLSGGIYFLNILKNKEVVNIQKIAITK